MLMLLFRVGNQHYALDTAPVLEIVPMVILRKLSHAPEYMAGVFSFQGQVIPVLDLSHRIQGIPSRISLSTRIILLQLPYLNHGKCLLGLIAEHVTETLKQSPSNLVESGYQSSDAPFLGKMIVNQENLIQCIEVNHLLSPQEQDNLLIALEGSPL